MSPAKRQCASVSPSNSLPVLSGVARRFAWLAPCRYAIRCTISSAESVSSRPSGIVDTSLVRRDSISDFAITRRSRSVRSTSDESVSPCEDAGYEPLVARPHHRRQVVLTDHTRRIDDVREQVVEVRAVRAGELRPDVTAGPEQRVALQAGAREDLAAARSVAAADHVHRQALLEPRDVLQFVVGRRLDRAPHEREPFRELRIAEGLDLARREGPEVRALHALVLDRVEQQACVARARSQRVDQSCCRPNFALAYIASATCAVTESSNSEIARIAAVRVPESTSSSFTKSRARDRALR